MVDPGSSPGLQNQTDESSAESNNDQNQERVHSCLQLHDAPYNRRWKGAADTANEQISGPERCSWVQELRRFPAGRSFVAAAESAVNGLAMLSPIWPTLQPAMSSLRWCVRRRFGPRMCMW
jgi:hypothetical protein